ncbi:hypothetical protein KCP71_00620 [Salmonella enterica subsp. enterica]|nr:hypothetical protein KCP71_00620 [Salmonella enterica subsp. enterica]
MVDFNVKGLVVLPEFNPSPLRCGVYRRRIKITARNRLASGSSPSIYRVPLNHR